jgi:hypothetical protein
MSLQGLRFTLDTGSGHIEFVYGKTHSGTIAAPGGNQGGVRFGGGMIKLSLLLFSFPFLIIAGYR